MAQYILIAATAGLIAFISTPATLMLARRFGFIAIPNTRKTHHLPIPLLGGVAIWAGLIISLLFFADSYEYRELAAIAFGGTLISTVGLIDDRLGLRARTKLFWQVVAASILILGNIQVRFLNNDWLNSLVTIIWVVGICNAINFLDNMDGLAAGVAAIAALSFLVIATLNAQVLVAGLAAALFGACLGFLIYNFQPALSFMGDAGSLLLGYMLAILGIKLNFQHISQFSTWMVPIVVLGLPILDTTLVTLSRLRRRVSIAQGGADHLSHRLTRIGLSHRRAVLSLYLASGGLGVIAAAMIYTRPEVANTVFAILVFIGLGVIWLFEEVYRQPATSPFRANLRIVFIGGGEAMLPLLRGAMTISQRVTMLITPGENEIPVLRLNSCLTILADYPAAVTAILEKAGTVPMGSVTDMVKLWDEAFRLKGRMAITVAPAETATPSELVLESLQTCDLILIGGDLNENVLATLRLPQIATALRDSKRVRILAHPDPRRALSEIRKVAGEGLITHLITSNANESPWVAVANLVKGDRLAEALTRIWLMRTNVRGAPMPISENMYD